MNDSTLFSDDVTDLLGAYVLDAVDDVERRRVERAIAADPAVAAEVSRLRRSVDALADSFDTEPPPAVWGAIRSQLDTSGDGRAVEPATVRSIGSARSSSKRPVLLVAASVVAVLVLGGSLVVGLSRRQSPTDSIATMRAMANDAATKPGARQAVLTDPGRTMEVKVVVDPEGHGFVMTDPLPALSENETYQLWSAADGTMVSLGMLGPHPEMSMVPIDATVTELALTREPAQGSVAPTSAPMATGTLI